VLLLALCRLELPWCAVVMLFEREKTNSTTTPLRIYTSIQRARRSTYQPNTCTQNRQQEELSHKQDDEDTNNTMTKKIYLLNKKKKTPPPSTTTFIHLVE